MTIAFLKCDTKVRYLHAMWHTFVIAGSVYDIAVLVYAAGGY